MRLISFEILSDLEASSVASGRSSPFSTPHANFSLSAFQSRISLK